MKSNNLLDSGAEMLSIEEMLGIRGGAEVPKPVTRPREVWDPNEAFTSSEKSGNYNEQTILSILLNWLKK
jgi:hypothetical protein